MSSGWYEVEASMNTCIIVIVQTTFNFQLFLQILFELFIDEVNDYLSAEIKQQLFTLIFVDYTSDTLKINNLIIYFQIFISVKCEQKIYSP